MIPNAARTTWRNSRANSQSQPVVQTFEQLQVHLDALQARIEQLEADMHSHVH